jgi:hypothetical protein
MSDDRIRYLLADEVGLAKTIEAGLVFRELKLRGLVKRVLVVAPKGLVPQWVEEMRTHFNEEFQLLTPGEFSLWRNLTGSDHVWRHFDQVVCPIDAIKPVERRRGWTRADFGTIQVCEVQTPGDPFCSLTSCSEPVFGESIAHFHCACQKNIILVTFDRKSG